MRKTQGLESFSATMVAKDYIKYTVEKLFMEDIKISNIIKSMYQTGSSMPWQPEL